MKMGEKDWRVKVGDWEGMLISKSAEGVGEMFNERTPPNRITNSGFTDLSVLAYCNW